MSIRTKVHLWWTWMRIAAQHCGMARRARSGESQPISFENQSGSNLSLEFESALVAIAAVAFAMEALSQELGLQGFKLDDSRFSKPEGKTNAGFYIGHKLVQAFDLKGDFACELPTRLEEVFQLRHDSVHFKSFTREGLKPHPSGTLTSEELTIFTFEASLKAVKLGRAVINECKISVEEGRSHQAAKGIAGEFAGVLSMLDEVLAAEGLANK